MKRQIVLDTETTGLYCESGDRIVEIGAVELIDKKRTGRTFHTYINPQRSSSEEALKVHKLTDEFLSDKPLFKDIANDFLKFINGAEVLIHNAKFDIGFLNKELDIINKGKLWDHITNAIDTLELSKRLFSKIPKGEVKGHKLDNMCERFGIDKTERDEKGHGALLDADLLAQCYIKINEIHSAEDIEADLEQTNWTRPPIKRFTNINLLSIVLTAKEEVQHEQFLAQLGSSEKLVPVFNRSQTSRPRV